MLWFTIWFMVILKIPALYLAYVIWWAVKDPPEAHPDTRSTGQDEGDGGPGWDGHRRRRRPTRRGGPHTAPMRRPALRRRARTAAGG